MIRVLKYLLLYMGILGLPLTTYTQDVKLYPHTRVLKLGDDITWATPGLDDRLWDLSGQTNDTEVFWVRFKIDIDERIDQLKNKGVHIISLGSFEAYWDGKLIYKNGKIGNDINTELPGTFISEFLLPDSMSTYGEHTMAFRVSNFHNARFKGSWNNFHIGEYMSSQRKTLRLTAIMFILGGIYLIAGIYYMFVFFNQKKDYVNLIFGLMCILFFALIFMEFYKFLVPYLYHFHYYRLLIIGLLTLAIAFLVPFFLHILLRLPFRKYFSPIYLFLILYLIFHFNILNDHTTQLLSTVMLVVSFIITLYALFLKRKGSWIIFIALAIIGILNYFSTYQINHLLFNYDINLFVGFTVLILAIMYLMAQKSKAQELAYESSLLRSARLQNELLKKNIQPHFIMNTLTSIMEWVEVSPKKSISFIESLAGEFEILNKIADLKLIPIQQEIALCKQHLEIMRFRKEVDYLWEENEIDHNQQVPPAIFHTIVENGITHSIPVDGKVVFRLNYLRIGNKNIYTLRTIAQNRKNHKKESGGTGFKYIRSRLNESYGSNWSLSSAEQKNGWETKITTWK